ncbi:MAG: hypothetical protein HYX75_19420 [Acidobacteria bacterium]|nr:hypothetical protein [Acidobacteriota bacterium]
MRDRTMSPLTLAIMLSIGIACPLISAAVHDGGQSTPSFQPRLDYTRNFAQTSALTRVPDNHPAKEAAKGRKCKVYFRITDWSCVTGEAVGFWINGVYQGFISGPGTYYMAQVKKGVKYQFYAEDGGEPVHMWRKDVRIKSTASTYTWTIACY